MKISDLSRLSGTPVGTIKYYLREGLLPPGRPLGATLTLYGDEHVQRLRLIRALTARGGLSIAATRDVLAAIDEPLDPLATLGVVHYALPTPVDAAETDAVEEQAPRVDELVRAMGWDVSRTPRTAAPSPRASWTSAASASSTARRTWCRTPSWRGRREARRRPGRGARRRRGPAPARRARRPRRPPPGTGPGPAASYGPGERDPPQGRVGAHARGDRPEPSGRSPLTEPTGPRGTDPPHPSSRPSFAPSPRKGRPRHDAGRRG
ncbi:MerR family transcriptional regulator [Streptomyces diastatochromogenes]|nr:MerR family transcriptional regulator [Streptomyces diastatochromogenes]